MRRLLVLRPLVLPALVLAVLPAAPAAAAGGITSPGPGAVVAADGVLPLRAVVEGPAVRPSQLTLQAPGAEVGEVVAVSTSPNGGELASDLNTRCTTAVCTPAANGEWVLRLSGAADDERRFVLRIPPAAPVDVVAQRSQAGVSVRWRRGDEPDLVGYAVRAASGDVVVERIGLDACDAGRRCAVDVPEDGGAWSVTAYRSTCPDCGEVLASPASALVRATDEQPGGAGALPRPVAPSPPPSDDAPRPAAPDQDAAFSRFFTAAAPLSAVVPPQRAQPPAAQPSDGTYDRSLVEGAPGAPVDVGAARPAPPLVRAQQAVGDLLGAGQRMRLLALSALLLGASFWLRRWARRPLDE